MSEVIGITFGAFDFVHAGHVLFLNNCRSCCDSLWVGLHVDPSAERIDKNRPIQTVIERMIQLKACIYVDNVFAYETERDVLNVLGGFTFHKRFLDSSYRTKIVTGLDLCAKRGIETVYFDREHEWSSSELRQRVMDAVWK